MQLQGSMEDHMALTQQEGHMLLFLKNCANTTTNPALRLSS